LPYWHLAAIAGVLLLIGAVVELAEPWPWAVMLDNVFDGLPLPRWLAPFFNLQAGRIPLLVAMVAAGVFISFAHNVISVVSNYVETKLEQWMVLDFRSDLFRHAQRLSMAFHDRRRAGMMIYVINSQGEAGANLVMSVPGIAYSVLMLGGMFIIIFRMNWGLAVLATCVLPFLVYSVRYYTTRIQDRLYKTKMLEGESLSIVHEAISMLRVIVAFGREPHEHQRFRDQAAKALNARVDITIRQTLF
jgi:ATP-binding cassette subfamily B protein/subfamily B ATP-binding cassette protein MsbA